MSILTKTVIWISTSLLFITLVLGTFGFFSYRSAGKYIKNLESEYKKTSELKSFKTLAGDLKKEKIAVISAKKDDINFTLLKITDVDDRKALLDAVDKKNYVEIEKNIVLSILDSHNYTIPIKRPCGFGKINFLTKVGFILKKKTTIQRISELSSCIGKKTESSGGENKGVIIFLNIVDEKKVEIFRIESENDELKNTSEEPSFIIKESGEEDMKGEISEYIAYIIEKNRKEEEKTEEKQT